MICVSWRSVCRLILFVLNLFDSWCPFLVATTLSDIAIFVFIYALLPCILVYTVSWLDIVSCRCRFVSHYHLRLPSLHPCFAFLCRWSFGLTLSICVSEASYLRLRNCHLLVSNAKFTYFYFMFFFKIILGLRFFWLRLEGFICFFILLLNISLICYSYGIRGRGVGCCFRLLPVGFVPWPRFMCCLCSSYLMRHKCSSLALAMVALLVRLLGVLA